MIFFKGSRHISGTLDRDLSRFTDRDGNLKLNYLLSFGVFRSRDTPDKSRRMETYFFLTRIFERVLSPIPRKGHVRKGKTMRSVRPRLFCPTSIFYLAGSIPFYPSRSFPSSVLWTRLHPRIPYSTFFLRPCLCRLGHAREFNSILKPGRRGLLASKVKRFILLASTFTFFLFLSFISFSEESTRDTAFDSSRF